MKKFGLLGKNISYTLSPTLHKKIFELYNIKAIYDIYDLSDENLLKNFLNELKENNLSGINVTIPYKTAILKFVDEISPEVKAIGATNCIKFHNGKLIAYNTDYFGLVKTFEKMKLNLKNKKVMILGSGGASKAAVKALLDFNARVTVISRNPLKAKLEFKYLCLPSYDLSFFSYEELAKYDGYLIINATPIGTYPNIDESPVTSEILQNFDFVLDLIYNPEETMFLKYAKEKNKEISNGLYMLISQGIKSEEIWLEQKLDYEKIYASLIEEIYK